ncbi:hypothetical protein KFK09_018496 [Dendrobium nobile]|uniref:Integrase catalytic domain-containing protein n=1 Tax=Dendrobium nobile TaxID=94219 RepID=A0A8T3AW36_DENNO|nr:hypothetical protein KFK09_018496 [Dendrobium nobile]
MLTPISLDQLYPLLLSKEINIASNNVPASPSIDQTNALVSYRGHGRHSRNRNYANQTSGSRPPALAIICQICYNKGHSAQACWHRLNLQYTPPNNNDPKAAFLAQSDTASTNWFLDSGASSHLTNSLENLSAPTSYQGHDSVTIGDGRAVNILHSGQGLLPTPSRKFFLSQILHTLSLKYNILSISKLTKDNNICVIFNPSGFLLKDMKTHEVLLQGPCSDGLYSLQSPSLSASQPTLAATTTSQTNWHQRLGHPHTRILYHISHCNPQLHIDKQFLFSKSCTEAKGHKLPFAISEHRHKIPLSLVHFDVWGPAPVSSVQGFLYYVIFIDDFSRLTWIYPMRQKSEVTNIFIHFKTYVEKFTSYHIKTLRTDGGKEYDNKMLNQFLTSHGILHQSSCPYTQIFISSISKTYIAIAITNRTHKFSSQAFSFE